MSSNSTKSTVVLVAALISAVAVLSAVAVRRQVTNNKLQGLKKELEELEKQEAKQQTETSTKTTSPTKSKIASPPNNILKVDESSSSSSVVAVAIGTVHSIYRLCVGTPRQGLLAPSARGRIELINLGDSSASDSVLGLEGYSHVWILFEFHLNTKSASASTSSSSKQQRTKTKVAPPALGGQKVGILATRTPHRFNPIGITLCKLDRIERQSVPGSNKNKKQQKVTLFVSGLDLVDGTPVLDIKPYVPVYDAALPNDVVRVPSWVEGGLATKRHVTISPTAHDELRQILLHDPSSLEFYGPTQGDLSLDETMTKMLDCIQQVLAVDVRSSYQTKKARQGKFQAERSQRVQDRQKTTGAGAATANSGVNTDEQQDTSNDNNLTIKGDSSSEEKICTQQLDNLLIYYTVVEADEKQRLSSEGSGAEDTVHVQSIQLFIQKQGVGANPMTPTRDGGVEQKLVRGSSSSQHNDGNGNSNTSNAGVLNLPKLKPTPTASPDKASSSSADKNPNGNSGVLNLPKLKPTTSPEKVSPDKNTRRTSAVEANSDVKKDYTLLKSFWNQAAVENTPQGISPSEAGASHAPGPNMKVFQRSDKVWLVKATSGYTSSANSSVVDGVSPSKSQPHVHPTVPSVITTQTSGETTVSVSQAHDTTPLLSKTADNTTTVSMGGFQVAMKEVNEDDNAIATKPSTEANASAVEEVCLDVANQVAPEDVEQEKSFEEEARPTKETFLEEEEEKPAEEARVAKDTEADQDRQLKVDEAKLAEEKRLADEKAVDDARLLAEEEFRIAAAKKLAEEEQEKLAEEARIAEVARVEAEKAAEETRLLAEEKRVADEKAAAEEKRLADEKAVDDARLLAEEEVRIAAAKKLAEGQEQEKLAEEARIAEVARLEEEKAAEETRLQALDAARVAAERAAEEEKNKMAEEACITKQKRLSDEKAAEDARLQAEEDSRIAAGKNLADEMLAERARRAESKRVKEEKAAEEAHYQDLEDARVAKERAVENEKAELLEKARMTEEKRLSDKKAAEDALLFAEQKVRRLAEQKQMEEEKAVEEARLKALEEARVAIEKAAEEARQKALEAEIAEEKRLAQEKAEEARLLSEKRDALLDVAKKMSDEISAAKAKRAEAKRMEEEEAAEEARLKALAEARVVEEKAAEEERRKVKEEASSDEVPAYKNSAVIEKVAGEASQANDERRTDERSAEEANMHDALEDRIIEVAIENQIAAAEELDPKAQDATGLVVVEDELSRDPSQDVATESNPKREDDPNGEAVDTNEAKKKGKSSKAAKWKERMAVVKQRKGSGAPNSDPQCDESVSDEAKNETAAKDPKLVMCAVCGDKKEASQFSKSQLKRGTCKCKDCVAKIDT